MRTSRRQSTGDRPCWWNRVCCLTRDDACRFLRIIITMSHATPTINQRKTLMQRLGILLSGRGSNFLAIAKAIGEQRLHDAEIAVVLSNIEDAPRLAAAHPLQLPAFALPSAGPKHAHHDAEIIPPLHHHKLDPV